MVITIQNIIDESAELEIKCLGCGRIVIFRGERLLSELDKLEAVRNVQSKMKCGNCSSSAQIIVKWPDVELNRENRRRVLGR